MAAVGDLVEPLDSLAEQQVQTPDGVVEEEALAEVLNILLQI
jgi:hypothetical protein